MRCRAGPDVDLRKRKNPGDDLFSRKAALSVSSALESLTSVFGMGTGVASPLESPGFHASGRSAARRRARDWPMRGAPKRSSISSQVDRSRFPASDPWSVAEEVKPSTISTAQLHPSPDFHMRPIKQVVSLRSYPVDPVGNLILRRASHLDAFSAYPNRTYLPSNAIGVTTGTTLVRPLRSSRTRSSSSQVPYAHGG